MYDPKTNESSGTIVVLFQFAALQGAPPPSYGAPRQMGYAGAPAYVEAPPPVPQYQYQGEGGEGHRHHHHHESEREREREERREERREEGF